MRRTSGGGAAASGGLASTLGPIGAAAAGAGEASIDATAAPADWRPVMST